MPMLRRDAMRRVGLRPPRMRVRRVTSFSINRMIPNVLTLLALCAGMSAIRYAVIGKFEAAVIAIIIAGILDGLDGRMARLLKANSSFGAQLDSLSDFLSFGAAPAIVLYFWTLAQLGALGWVIALFFAACCALRLARFNTQLDVELPPYAYNFFTGVPAPAGAGLVIITMFIAFEWGDAVARSPWLNAVIVAATAALMVSRVPTVSLKRVRIHHDYVVPALLVVGVLAAFLTTAPWPVMAALGLVYLGSMPFSIARFYTLKRTYEAPQPAAPAPAAEAGAPLSPPPAAGTEAPGTFTRH
jgi:CDP-diacylglycerol---serine O-phosphatidyltransferase